MDDTGATEMAGRSTLSTTFEADEAINLEGETFPITGFGVGTPKTVGFGPIAPASNIPEVSVHDINKINMFTTIYTHSKEKFLITF